MKNIHRMCSFKLETEVNDTCQELDASASDSTSLDFMGAMNKSFDHVTTKTVKCFGNAKTPEWFLHSDVDNGQTTVVPTLTLFMFVFLFCW